MVAEFDPVIQKHVERITNDDIHIHYIALVLAFRMS
jgi:hypothetical protein